MDLTCIMVLSIIGMNPNIKNITQFITNSINRIKRTKQLILYNLFVGFFHSEMQMYKKKTSFSSGLPRRTAVLLEYAGTLLLRANTRICICFYWWTFIVFRKNRTAIMKVKLCAPLQVIQLMTEQSQPMKSPVQTSFSMRSTASTETSNLNHSKPRVPILWGEK